MAIESFKLNHIEMFIKSWLGCDIRIFGIEYSEPMYDTDEESNVTENVQYVFVKYFDKDGNVNQAMLVWDMDDDDFFISRDFEESDSEDIQFKKNILQVA